MPPSLEPTPDRGQDKAGTKRCSGKTDQMLDIQFQTPAIPEMITFFLSCHTNMQKLEINRYKGAGGQGALVAQNLNLLELQIA